MPSLPAVSLSSDNDPQLDGKQESHQDGCNQKGRPGAIVADVNCRAALRQPEYRKSVGDVKQQDVSQDEGQIRDRQRPRQKSTSSGPQRGNEEQGHTDEYEAQGR